jgi:hypothetical protein
MPSIINATTTAGVAVTGDNSGALALQTNNGTTAVTIDTSQKVGIGTTSPTGKLHVYGSGEVQTLQRSSGSANNYTLFKTESGADQAYLGFSDSGVNDFAIYNVQNGYVRIGTNNTERMRITSAGFVKASNNGSYFNSSGTYHEFKTTLSDPVIFATATDASYGSNALILDVTRSASSANTFGLFRSSAGGDNEFVFRGDGNGYADGTWNNNGADYAEFFESATGQAIPVGSTVVLDGNKVRLATASDSVDDVIGVVRPKEPSKASMIVGNTAWNKWANKYLSDDFDRYIMEDHNVVEWTDEDNKSHSYESHNIPTDVVVPANAVVKTHDDKGNKFQHYKLNPEWNPNAEYVNRENRDEWLIIGLIGQVKVLKGQVMGERWKKMRDVSQSVEEWFIR